MQAQTIFHTQNNLFRGIMNALNQFKTQHVFKKMKTFRNLKLCCTYAAEYCIYDCTHFNTNCIKRIRPHRQPDPI